MINKLKNKYFTESYLGVYIFFPTLMTITLLLIFSFKIGLIILIGFTLFLIALLKPKILFLLLISTFSIEGFAMIPGASIVKIIGFLLVSGLTIRIALTKEWIRNDDNYVYIIMFLIGGVISTVFAENPSLSRSVLITYISLFALYILTRYFLNNLSDIRGILNILFLSTILIIVIVQAIGFSVRGTHISRISSGIGDPNEYASYILTLIPLALYLVMHSIGLSKLMYIGYFFVFLILLILTESRGGVLGFLGMAGILIYYYGMGKLKQISLIIIIIAIVAYLFAPEEFWTRALTIIHPESEHEKLNVNSIGTRLKNYKIAIQMFLDHPLIGVGIHNFKIVSLKYGAYKEKVVHNSYLEILSGGGVLSFMPFLLILLGTWKKLKVSQFYDKNTLDLLICLKASFVSILITSFFITAEHKKILWFLFALISAVHYIVSNQLKTNILKLKNTK